MVINIDGLVKSLNRWKLSYIKYKYNITIFKILALLLIQK